MTRLVSTMPMRSWNFWRPVADWSLLKNWKKWQRIASLPSWMVDYRMLQVLPMQSIKAGSLSRYWEEASIRENFRLWWNSGSEKGGKIRARCFLLDIQTWSRLWLIKNLDVHLLRRMLWYAVITGVGADEIVAFGFDLQNFKRLTESASKQIIQVDFTDLCPFCYANFKVFAESPEELLGGQRFFFLHLNFVNGFFCLSWKQLGWWCFFFPTENSEAKKFCICKVSWNCFKTRICHSGFKFRSAFIPWKQANITCVGFSYTKPTSFGMVLLVL